MDVMSTCTAPDCNRETWFVDGDLCHAHLVEKHPRKPSKLSLAEFAEQVAQAQKLAASVLGPDIVETSTTLTITTEDTAS